MKDDYTKRLQVYGAYRKWIVNAINDSFNESITGAESDKRLALFNMFHLLVQMRNEKYASARPLKKDIECMRDALFCHGVDTTEMEKIFFPSYDDETGNEWGDGTDGGTGGGSDNRPDGIEFMQVMGDGKEHPINRIK